MRRMLLVLAILCAAALLIGERVLRHRARPAATPSRSERTPAAAPVAMPGAGLPEETIPEAGLGVVEGSLVGRLPEECRVAGGARLRIEAREGVLVERRVGLGPFRLAYRRVGSDFALSVGGERVLPRRFALPGQHTALGEIALRAGSSFGGRVLTLDGAPIEGASVTWGHDGARSSPTGADGVFRLELEELPWMGTDRDGYLRNATLSVGRGTSWGGPFLAHVSGFDLAYDMRITLEPGPVLRFVAGAHQPALEGLRLHLYDAPSMEGGARLPPPAGTLRLPADGTVTPDWPPWIAQMHARLDLGEGHPLQLWIDRQEVCSFPVYEISVDRADTALVRVRVLAAEGDAPATGARVCISGGWKPDGPDRDLGMQGLLLYGEVPASGEIVLLFPAEKHEESVFVPFAWWLEDAAGRERRFGEYAERTPVLDGGSLPVLRLGEGEPRAGAPPPGTKEGEVRELCVRVLHPDGRPAGNVLVAAALPDATGAQQRCARVTADAAGVAVLRLEAGRGPWAVVAHDAKTWRAAHARGIWPGSSDLRLRLREPVALRFRLLLPDGRPVRAGNASFQTRPSLLLPPLGAEGKGDGWFAIRAIVPEVYEAHVSASDLDLLQRYHALGVPLPRCTHRLVLPAERIGDGAAIALPLTVTLPEPPR